MAHTRPFLTTSVALASAAAIAVPTGPGLLAAGSSIPALSAANYELTALTDITIAGLAGAFTNGWGGFIGADDPFYPGAFNNDITLSGLNGLAYYIADQALDGIAPYDVVNYFFEVGSQSAGNQLYAGLGAVAYVGVGSILGPNSLPAQLVKSLADIAAEGSLGIGSILDSINLGPIDLGSINLFSAGLGSVVVALTAGVPVLGVLTSVYFTGKAPGDATVYGTGFAGLAAYANNVLPGISDILDNVSAGIFGSSDDDDDDDDYDDDDYDYDDDFESEGKGKWKVKSSAAAAPTDVAATAALVDVPQVTAESAPVALPSAPTNESEISETAIADSDTATESAAPMPTAPRRGGHRGDAAGKAGAGVDTAKRAGGRSARNN